MNNPTFDRYPAHALEEQWCEDPDSRLSSAAHATRFYRRSANRLHARVQLFEGKFRTVKTENNALRRQVAQLKAQLANTAVGSGMD